MPVARSDITCTPEGVLGINPCVTQLSQSQKLAGIVLLLCAINNQSSASCTPEDVLPDCICWSANTSLDPLTAIVNILLDYAIANGYVESGTALLQAGNCWSQLPEPQLIGVILCQLCTYIHTLENLPN